MKLVFAFLLSLFLVSCSLMQPRTAKTTSQLSEKEITTITQLIGKEKIPKRFLRKFLCTISERSFRKYCQKKAKTY